MTTDMEIDEIEKKDEKEEENGKLDETNEKTQHDSDLSTFTSLFYSFILFAYLFPLSVVD